MLSRRPVAAFWLVGGVVSLAAAARAAPSSRGAPAADVLAVASPVATAPETTRVATRAPRRRDLLPMADESGLALEPLPIEMSHAIPAFRYLLDEEEVNVFDALPSDEARREWMRRHWSQNDPILTTPDNERLMLHEHRVAYAETAFVISAYPGWDDRGEVFIRYGEPSYRFRAPAEITTTGWLPAYEIWYYAPFDCFVRFEDVKLSGEFTRMLRHDHAVSAMRAENVMKTIDANFDAPSDDRLMAEDMAALSQSDRFQKRVVRYDEVRQKTPSVTWLNYAAQTLPFYFGVDCFRGGEGQDRVDVCMEFIGQVSTQDEYQASKDYLATAVFWNTDREEVARRMLKIRLPAVQSDRDSLRLVPSLVNVTLPPDFYHMAVTLQDLSSRRFSSYRATVTCESYDEGLALSDILFAAKIRDAMRPSRFARGEIDVIPHPMRRYATGYDVPIYFEVYHLAPDGRGDGRYTVEYRVLPRDPEKRGFWATLTGKKAENIGVASRFSGVAKGTHDQVHVTIGTGNLWVGDYDLQITVTDKESGDEATRTVGFHIVE